MPFHAITAAFPALGESLSGLPAVTYTDPLWDMLQRLLVAHAPSGGANLLGGVGDDIVVLADGLGLGKRAIPYLGSTGNAAIWIGADKPQPDVVITAHMDRPSFRVRNLQEGTLFAICANRFPPGEYRIPAKAVRFDNGRLVVGAEGMLVSHKTQDRETLRFEVKRGSLAWGDTVLIGVTPVRDGDTVVGAGLDNSLGVLTALLTAAALHAIEDTLRAADRRCLFVFTDQEEGPPEGFFGHGAARLAHTVPPPTIGCIVVDGQNAGPGLDVELGSGAAHGVVSGRGHGAIVPPNYHALALDLARQINEIRPGTVQMNTGYLSRSDDMILGRWTQVLAMIGPPMTDPHTGHETARLSDIQDSVWWLAHFVIAALNMVPALAPRYGLGR